MNIRLLRGDPDAHLAAAIGRFEQEFTYPLGAGRRFRIAHDGDGWRFFAALGEAAYLVVEDGEGVIGILGAALRRISTPDSGKATALYIGDLKIAARARGGLVLIRLLRAVREWVGSRTTAAFAVVMDGTIPTPEAYTGRLGLPLFRPLDAIAILWLHTAGAALPVQPSVDSVGAESGAAVFSALSTGDYRLEDTDPALRSVLTPGWLALGEKACGRLEDTLRAKRLTTTDGEEMRSAHLSCFAYLAHEDGLAVLATALERAAAHGYPMLFTAVPAAEAEAWRASLGDRVRSVATATVFGTGLARPGLAMSDPWRINTADI